MSESIREKGKLSVHTENILPVIKKWLYSEKEIFLRELVSNSLDAITKLRKASMIEDVYEPENTDFAIDITIDREKGHLCIEDNGIGMTAEEIRKYITQIAFSGAEDFVKKYEQSQDKSKSGIIGNFGLGFYSSFMVSTRVEIESRSYRPEAEAAFWTSDGGEEFEIGPSSRTKRGTLIRLVLDEDEKYLLDKAEISNLVRKYCDFLPVVIRVDGSQVNRQNPLWSKQPSTVQKEEYLEFYRYLFPYQGDPLFYVHLNVDYPFKLQGILYFPHLAHEFDLNKSNVKIYCKQVFVTEEAQDIIPKFLTVLQGVIDLPDLPLNVSRSYVQTDPEVRKIAAHIVKKVADRLVEEFKNNRDSYNKIWSEISPFVKYAMLNDDKFYEQAKEAIVFETVSLSEGTEKAFVTLDDYIVNNKSKTAGKVFYTSDPKAQASSLRLLKDEGIQVLHLGALIDTHFIQFLESKDKDLHFSRIDAELSDIVIDKNASTALVDSENKSVKDRITELFTAALANPKISIRVEALKSENLPAVIILPEQMRRFSEMAALMSQKHPEFPEEHTLVINSKSKLILALAKPSIVAVGEDGNPKREKTARMVYQLARLSQGGLGLQDMEKFVNESYNLLESLV